MSSTLVALIERATRVRGWLETATGCDCQSIDDCALFDEAAAFEPPLTGYGAVAALQPDANFGRVLASYGGVFIVGSLAWGVIFDGFRPDRYDVSGAIVCLAGVALIMYPPR